MIHSARFRSSWALLAVAAFAACQPPAPAASPGATAEDPVPADEDPVPADADPVPANAVVTPTAPAPPSAVVPAPGRVGPVVGPVPTGPPRCDQRPADPFLDCAAGDAVCAQSELAQLEAHHAWTLACEAITPVAPIQGESIMAWVPHGPSTSEEDCTAGRIQLRRHRQDGVMVVNVALNQTGDCDALLSLTGVDLGVLPAGAYRIETSNFSHDFTVRPKGSDPGDLEESALVQAAVAREHSPGQCFGMPGPRPSESFLDDFATSRTASLMRKAFPGASDAELKSLLARMRAILVGQTGSGAWTYSYRDGHCCTVNQVEGTVARDADGSLSVGAPRVVASDSVPC